MFESVDRSTDGRTHARTDGHRLDWYTMVAFGSGELITYEPYKEKTCLKNFHASNTKTACSSWFSYRLKANFLL